MTTLSKKPTSRNTVRSTALLGAAALVVVAGAGATAVYSTSKAVDPETDCLAHEKAPNSNVIAIDTTDQLIAEQVGYVERKLGAIIDNTQPYERFAVVEISGNINSELEPLIARCFPLQNSNVARNRLKAEVLAPVRALLDELGTRAANPQSPIIESIVAISDRADWKDKDGKIKIYLLTDGLQNTGRLTFYGQNGAQPVLGSPLAGITVQILPLTNRRDASLQAAAFDRMERTLSELGATVEFHRPGWLTLSEL